MTEVIATKEYPACINCGNAMVWSFAMSGCEYVCLPCDEGVPMWNGRPKLSRSVDYMNAKKHKWSLELSIISRRFGGGSCAVCGDGSCKYCVATADPNYEFKYWKKNVHPKTAFIGKEVEK